MSYAWSSWWTRIVDCFPQFPLISHIAYRHNGTPTTYRLLRGMTGQCPNEVLMAGDARHFMDFPV